MRKARFVPAFVCMAALCAGCSTTQRVFHSHHPSPEPVALTVRFVPPPEDGQFASGDFDSPDARLVREGTGSLVGSGFAPTTQDPPTPCHVVLWGGPFYGEEVTYRPTRLTAGPYMFGMFDPDRGSAFQGWLAVNNGGDDVLSALNQWRDTVREQQDWLGYEYKTSGKFKCTNHNHFAQFTQEIKSLRNLEAKIQQTIAAEFNYRRQTQWEWNQVLSDAEVLLMPGQVNFFSPSTKPAFSEEEISNLRDGQALTKVVLVGNFERSFEKLNRILDLQDELYRNRSIFTEEAQRLENRRHYLRLTSHLYQYNDKCFVENEQRFQQARGMIAKIDRQLEDYRRQCHALLFVTGLFAPDETFDAFDRQKAALARERVVLNEQKRQLDWQYNQASENSHRRIFVERQRQNVVAEIDKIDNQLGKIDETRVAVNKLRENTDVIHRHGPAQVLAATFVGEEIPALFVNAVERESLMTVRLESADSMFAPGSSITKVRSTFIEEDFWGGPTFDPNAPCDD